VGLCVGLDGSQRLEDKGNVTDSKLIDFLCLALADERLIPDHLFREFNDPANWATNWGSRDLEMYVKAIYFQHISLTIVSQRSRLDGMSPI